MFDRASHGAASIGSVMTIALVLVADGIVRFSTVARAPEKGIPGKRQALRRLSKPGCYSVKSPALFRSITTRAIRAWITSRKE